MSMITIPTVYGPVKVPRTPFICNDSYILQIVEQAREILNLPNQIPVYEAPCNNFFSNRGEVAPYNYGDEYILFDPRIARDLSLSYGFDVVKGYLCHEVGHVRNRYDERYPVPETVFHRWNEESKADFWAGYCLRHMGISIRPLIAHLINNPPTLSHPSGRQRRGFVRAGYNYRPPRRRRRYPSMDSCTRSPDGYYIIPRRRRYRPKKRRYQFWPDSESPGILGVILILLTCFLAIFLPFYFMFLFS